MKTLLILTLIGLFCASAQAQYVLQMGQKQLPIKTGDTLSKRLLLADSVWILFLPDTIHPSSGISQVGVITAEKSGKAKAYFVSGNILFPTFTKAVSDTLVSTMTIVQIRNHKSHVRSVNIKLKLIE